MDPTIYRSLLAIDPNTNFPISTNYILSTDGFGNLSWQNSIYNLSSISRDIGNLPSTIVNLSSQIYNLQQISPGSVPVSQFTSTVAGLGTANYISSSQLVSSIAGLSNAGYINSATGISSLGTYGYVSSTQLTSTVAGLGRANYISSSQLLSTINNLATTGYVSSTQLYSTLSNLGTYGYVSTQSLYSTVRGLATIGYVSSSQLTSTVAGLGTAGYVSIATLSTTVAQRLNVFFNTANTLAINGNNNFVSISSMNAPYFFSSFFVSSIEYKGNNGPLLAQQSTTGTTDFYISSLNTQIDKFSSFINNNSKITLDIYPNILFPNINSNGISRTFTVSSFLQYGGSPLFSTVHQTWLYGINNSASNMFNPAMKMNVSGGIINSNYVNPYTLVHRVVSAGDVAPNTFSNQNVTLFFDSTTSYYLTIQNLTN